jgi:hypothetical protein
MTHPARPSSRFNPSRLSAKIVPLALAVLITILLLTLALIIMSVLGVSLTPSPSPEGIVEFLSHQTTQSSNPTIPTSYLLTPN